MKKLILFFLIVFVYAISASGITPMYRNPIINQDRPDPAVLDAGDGSFYLFSTSSSKKVPILTSTDLIDWTYASDAFAPDQMPTGIEGGGIWAPDVIKHNGKYLMAYSYSKNGEYHYNGIGLAIADSPKGPYTNLGMLFTSDSSGVRNSIDPAFVEENDKLYLLWGSFNGLYIVELNQDKNGKYYIQNINDKIKLAGDAFEGSHIFKHGEYYYLFASVGRCCLGDDSSYRVVVGRSKNLFGPYVDETGNSMLNNGYNFVVGSAQHFVGPGHGSSIITDKDGRTWYIYHSYVRGQSSKGRMIVLDEMKWTKDGWPYIYKGAPASGPIPGPNL